MECRERQLCPHKKQKAFCVECEGSQICIHKKQKGFCVECGGSQMCTHGIRRVFCIQCAGSSICVHKIRKDYCVACGGSRVCCHGRYNKSVCILCKEQKAKLASLQPAKDGESVQLAESPAHLAELVHERLLCPQCEEYKDVVEFIDMSSEFQIPSMQCNNCTDLISKGEGGMCTGGCFKFLFAQQGTICQNCKDKQEGAAGGAPGGVHGSSIGAEPELAADLLQILNADPDL